MSAVSRTPEERTPERTCLIREAGDGLKTLRTKCKTTLKRHHIPGAATLQVPSQLRASHIRHMGFNPLLHSTVHTDAVLAPNTEMDGSMASELVPGIDRTTTTTTPPHAPPAPSASSAPPTASGSPDQTATGSDRSASQSRMAASGQTARERLLAGAQSGAAAASAALPEGVQQAGDAMRDFETRIGALDSAGDTAHLRITAELKAQGNVRLGKAGGKGQLGARISVTRDSDAPDTTYTVRYDKQTTALAIGEIGTDQLGRGRGTGAGAKTGASGGTAKAELGGQSFDVVEMTFATKEEAARAAGILQKLHTADAINDSVDITRLLAAPALGPIGPLVAQGASQVPTNPVIEPGAPGSVSTDLAGLEQSELDFIRSNITAYETTMGSRGRLALELKLKREGIVPGIEGRLDGNQRITRRVELPTDTEDGKVSYTLSGNLRLSAKERLNRQAFGPLTAKLDNRLELARNTAAVTFEFRIPKGTEMTTTSGDRPVPEYDGYAGNLDLTLDRVSVENRTDIQTQGLQDPSRGDITRLTERLTIENPEAIAPAAEALFAGEFEEAARLAGAEVTLTAQDITRTGVDVQPGFKLDLGIAAVEGSVILAAGTDDIVRERALTIAPGDTPAPARTGDDGKTFAVLPFEGVSIRGTAGGERVSVAQSGTFLRDTGAREADANGQEWMKVTGTDVNDAAVEGWVRADLLVPFDSTKGAMDATGRVNPTAEANRMDEVRVVKDDNLWNLARANGWDFDETLAANRHLIDPALIFAGDTVYVPGSAKGPPPATPEAGSDSVATDSRADPDAPALSPPRQAVSDTAGSAVESGAPTPPSPAPEVSDVAPTLPSPPAMGESPAELPSISGPNYEIAAPTAPTAPAAGTPPEGDAQLQHILATYQVEADTEMRVWTPKLRNGVTETIAGGLAGLGEWVTGRDLTGELEAALQRLDNRPMPDIEADALDKLGPIDQARWVLMTQETAAEAPFAYDPPAGVNRHGIQWTNDSHVDAYRHAIWNARMTHAFGADWTRVYATAHEKIAGNPAQREAMDLWNNELGRRIATENPRASDTELQHLVKDAIANGEAIVLGSDLTLQWSDDVELGQNGYIEQDTAPVRELPGGAVDIDEDDLNTASG